MSVLNFTLTYNKECWPLWTSEQELNCGAAMARIRGTLRLAEKTQVDMFGIVKLGQSDYKYQIKSSEDLKMYLKVYGGTLLEVKRHYSPRNGQPAVLVRIIYSLS